MLPASPSFAGNPLRCCSWDGHMNVSPTTGWRRTAAASPVVVSGNTWPIFSATYPISGAASATASCTSGLEVSTRVYGMMCGWGLPSDRVECTIGGGGAVAMQPFPATAYPPPVFSSSV
eukprot:3079930-Prymnesium_polylepis.1